MAGVTPQGFESKLLEDILEDLRSKERARISTTINTTTEAPVGQINGIVGSVVRELWEVLGATYAASSILTATGVALDRKVALTTTMRKGAMSSRALVRLTLDPGVTVPALSEISVQGDPESRFATEDPVTNGGGAQADFEVYASAIETGATRANAGTLTVIETPVIGWVASTNDEDAILGSDTEADARLRNRYLSTAAGKGLSTVDSIRATVEAVDNVDRALVFENVLDFPVGGIPAHSINVVIKESGAIADEIAQAIWDSKAGGIGTAGALSGSATDSNGKNQVGRYDLVADVDVWIVASIATNRNFSDADGVAGLKQAIADWGDANLDIGSDVVIEQLRIPIFDFGGVSDILELRIGTSSGGELDQNLVIAPTELAGLDTGRITISSVPFEDQDA